MHNILDRIHENPKALRVWYVILNIVGSSLLAFGVMAFVEPYELIVGGATGISLITHRLTGIPISVISLVINVAVLIPGWIFGSKKLVTGSVLSSLVYPCAVAVFEHIPNIGTIADNAILATICGGVVVGAGIGLVMRSEGSTGGLDIPVLLICKYTHAPVNTVMNITDTCVMLGQLPFTPITGIIYGLIYTYIMTTSLGAVLTLGEDRLRVTVVSEHSEEICSTLTGNDFGVTMVYGESGYTKTPIKQVESVMHTRSCRLAQKLILGVDPEAFITVEKVKDVKGRGYTLAQNPINLDLGDRNL